MTPPENAACRACEGRREKERRTGHICDTQVPLCPRCGKEVRGWPLPPGSFVLGCGATLTVDDTGRAIAWGWDE